MLSKLDEVTAGEAVAGDLLIVNNYRTTRPDPVQAALDGRDR